VSADPQLAIDDELVVSFAGGEVLLTHARTKRQFITGPETLAILAAVADRSGEERARLVAVHGREPVDRAISQLQDAGLLRTARVPGIAERWRDWGPSAWLLHRMSSDTTFATDADDQIALADAFERTAPSAPPVFQCRCDVDRVYELPAPRQGFGRPVSDVMLARRTCRAFAEQELSVPDLADLLFHTGGWLYREDVPYFGSVVKKCAPSPGARHSIEIYPIVLRCDGVEPGICHYCSEHHRLARISKADPQQFAHQALLEQEYFSSASVVFLMTCVTGRLMWKYKTPRAYRLAHIEVGHYCQNLVLSATALSLGAFQTAAVADSLVHRVLGVDGEHEFVIYAAGVGPAKTDNSADAAAEISPWLGRSAADPGGSSGDEP
jgi:SagB-type dehydrogenase family enzyme